MTVYEPTRRRANDSALDDVPWQCATNEGWIDRLDTDTDDEPPGRITSRMALRTSNVVRLDLWRAARRSDRSASR